MVIFNEHLAGVAQNYLKKGARVYVEGQLQTRKWTDQAGTEKYSTEVILNRFRGDLQMLDRSGESSAEKYELGNSSNDDNSSAKAPAISDLDDEIPF